MPATELPLPEPIARSVHPFLCAISFTAVMLTGSWQMVLGAVGAEGLTYSRDIQDFREGRTTGALEKQLEQKMPSRQSLIGFANTLRYTLTRGAGEQVRLGQDDWLFLTDELRYEAMGEHNLEEHARLLEVVSQKLERQGVALIVALIPDKSRVYERQLLSGQYPSYHVARYRRMLTALNQRHVAVVDLLTPLQQAAQTEWVYYQSDTHWNQIGADIAAQSIALFIKKRGIDLEATSFVTNKAPVPTERPGDLIRLMGVDKAPSMLRPRSDQEALATTRQTSEVAPASLFGDAQIPVVLTGTSYSLRGNFHGYLQQALSAKVLNTAKDGGGFLTAAEAYFKDDAFRLSNPKVVVWEVPERFIHAKLSNASEWPMHTGL